MSQPDVKSGEKRAIKLLRLDRFKWFNAYLFIGCGAVLMVRSMHLPFSWLGALTGIAFLAFGIYRLRLFHRALRGELTPPRVIRRRAWGPRG